MVRMVRVRMRRLARVGSNDFSMAVCFIMSCPGRSFDEWAMISMMEREFSKLRLERLLASLWQISRTSFSFSSRFIF